MGAIVALDAALRDVREGSDGLQRVSTAHDSARALIQSRPDGSLYLLVYQAGQTKEKYSASHAMLSMLVCELAAPLLDWSAEHVNAVGRAALLMNVAMLGLQDRLAASEVTLTAELRAQIADHGAKGASMLAEAGLADELVIEAVRLHHDDSTAARALAELAAGQRLARLLRRVDIFTAKLSRRASRKPMSPVQAAREACLGQRGVPDEIGAALLKAVGLYPPGSFVELVSGEVAIVLARGSRANLPRVASLLNAGGKPLNEPALRDTVDQRHAIKCAFPQGYARTRPPHDKLLAMR